jgi:CelD/BcsL family acetyltransferase involved in cellulose biosynthesis/RimJ/RimL family protein N-acetyltransferase
LVRIYQGSAADERLRDAGFRREWAALYEACPWATCFQAEPFVTTWYRAYAERFSPVVVAGEDGGRLSGLFTLARDKRTGAIHAAGTHHAEYHVWLAPPGDGGQFIGAALAALADAFPRGRLQLLFAPPRTPLDWTAQWAGRAFVRAMPRPMMVTQPADAVRESLRKKSNKSRLNRMEKAGAVTLDRITDAAEFRAALDEIAELCDFRQGGANGVRPFHDDPAKAPFYAAMMEQPGLLHATVLRVGGQIAAAHIGQANRGEVVLGIVTHSPFFAQYSAGKLLLLLLGLLLEEEGFRALDLTPGGEFKDRFASAYDEAHTVEIFLSGGAARAYRMERAAVDFGKRFVDPARAKHVARAVRHKAALVRAGGIAGSLWRRLRRYGYERREYRVYRYAPAAVPKPVAAAMRRDCLRDLILYAPTESWQPRLDEFLRTAAERLEKGEHVYTLVQDGRLACWGWMIEQQAQAFISEVGQTLEMPPSSTVLYDYYTHPGYRGRGLYQQALMQMAYDAANIPGVQYIYIGALKDNRASCRAIEKTGFEYQRSLVAVRRLGKVTASP